VAGLLFVVTSMLAMGLSLTLPMVLQSLKNVRLVVMALPANFVLLPLLAYLIAAGPAPNGKTIGREHGGGCPGRGAGGEANVT
jgi:predicted Na+-dependent transporter